MDAMMMIQAKVTSKATVPGGGSGRVGGESQGSFAQYMDQKLNEDASRESLLGVKANENASVKTDSPASKAENKNEEVSLDDAQDVVGLLSHFLQELKDMSTDSEKTPADWSFSIADKDLLQQIAADAGMNENEMAALLQQYEDQDGVFDLRNFIATLTRHFEDQGEGVEVTVPETDLPFFETLLSKMGVPVEQIVDVADKGVTGDGKLDLTAFMNALQGVEGNGKPIVLSELETAELREIFSDIGVADALQNRLLTNQDNAGLPFSLERLQDVLQQGVANVKDSQPKLDLPAFLNDLQQVFTEAKFNEKSVGWSPAVQNAVSAAYEELLKSVDLSTVQVKVVQAATTAAFTDSNEGDEVFGADHSEIGKPVIAKEAEPVKPAAAQAVEAGKSAAAQAAEVVKPVAAQAAEVVKPVVMHAAAEVVKPVVAQVAGAVKPVGREVNNDIVKDLHGIDAAEEPATDVKIAAAVADAGDAGANPDREAGAEQGKFSGTFDNPLAGLGQEGHAASTTAAGRQVGFEQQMATEQGRAATPAPRMTPGLEQQTFQNISNNVLNGLKNNEHHLVLRLFPRELGEVKVEMTVRDQNISLSFAMENHKVKETLESNMQQFQDNLAKQGFNLQGCEVSVGQQEEDRSAAWQSFEQNRQQQGQGKSGRETLADLPGESMYIRPIHDTGREGGISLFI